MPSGRGSAARHILPARPAHRRERPVPMSTTAPVLRAPSGFWRHCCKGGKPASSNFEYGARLTEIVLLGNVALRSGKKIEWDAESLKAKNAPEADKLIKEQYRKGWEII